MGWTSNHSGSNLESGATREGRSLSKRDKVVDVQIAGIGAGLACKRIEPFARLDTATP